MNSRHGWCVLVLLGVLGTAASARGEEEPAPTQPEGAVPAPEPAPPQPTVVTPPSPAMAMPPPSSMPPAMPPAPSATVPATTAALAPPSFRMDLPGGNSLKVGLLLQPQLQVAGDLTRDGYARNLYLRRTRLLVGGTLFGIFEFFVDTDYPNLFLPANAAGAAGAPETAVKATPGMNIQDAYATWKALKDYVKVDAGYMLPPLAHNAVQGATTLYSWDYLTYTFQSGNFFNSAANPIGRDLGVQLRGLLVDGHLEYRAGLFQGLRNGQTETEVNSRNFFCFAARLQLNLLDAETGFFYVGSYLGTKRILSLGGAVDVEDKYRYFAGDVFVDLPVPGVGVATAQFNLAYWDGGTFIPALAKQTATMGEAGFLFSALQLGPIVRVEHLTVSGAPPDQTRIGGGLAYWPFGHNSNVKAFYSRRTQTGANHAEQIVNVQWQLYVY